MSEYNLRFHFSMLFIFYLAMAYPVYRSYKKREDDPDFNKTLFLSMALILPPVLYLIFLNFPSIGEAIRDFFIFSS